MYAVPPRKPRIPAPNDNPTIIKEPIGSPIAPFGDFIFQYASVADDFPAFGTNILARDRLLREFWPTEPLTASAMYSMVSKYSALEWSLEGPPRTVGIYQRMLNGVEFGAGWIAMMDKFLTDVFSQDNGGFLEIVRTSDSPDAPCVTMNHLDANRCQRTGHREAPVLYYDRLGSSHLLKWYQVIHFAEFASPVEVLRGIQLCAISRLLRAAQIMKDISIYKREKVSGRFNRAMYLVGGVQQRTINDMMKQQQMQANSDGLTRFLMPIVVASLDPGATVSVDVINFAALPENFDEETSMKWFISQLALTFGGDYQDFAPLPSGNMGSSGQSAVLHHKSLGKGMKKYMAMISQIMNYRGILPSNVIFRYGESDLSEDSSRAEMKLNRAKERQIRIMSGELTLQIARQIASDAGDLEPEYLMQMNEESSTTDIEAAGGDPVVATPELLKIGDDSAYTGTPDDNVVPGMNTWGAGAANGGDTSGSNGQAASTGKTPGKIKNPVAMPK